VDTKNGSGSDSGDLTVGVVQELAARAAQDAAELAEIRRQDQKALQSHQQDAESLPGKLADLQGKALAEALEIGKQVAGFGDAEAPTDAPPTAPVTTGGTTPSPGTKVGAAAAGGSSGSGSLPPSPKPPAKIEGPDASGGQPKVIGKSGSPKNPVQDNKAGRDWTKIALAALACAVIIAAITGICGYCHLNKKIDTTATSQTEALGQRIGAVETTASSALVAGNDAVTKVENWRKTAKAAISQQVKKQVLAKVKEQDKKIAEQDTKIAGIAQDASAAKDLAGRVKNLEDSQAKLSGTVTSLQEAITKNTVAVATLNQHDVDLIKDQTEEYWSKLCFIKEHNSGFRLNSLPKDGLGNGLLTKGAESLRGTIEAEYQRLISQSVNLGTKAAETLAAGKKGPLGALHLPKAEAAALANEVKAAKDK